MGALNKLLKRIYLIRADFSSFLNLLIIDLLFFFQPITRKLRNRLKERLHRRSKMFVKFGEHKYLCRADDIDILLEVHKDKVYHKRFTPKSNEVVVDLGANIGEYTIMAAKQAKNVIAFEPNKRAVDFLNKNIELNKLTNVQVIPKAAHSKTGTITLYSIPGTNTRDSICLFNKGKYFSESITLDEALKDKRIDIIKMDIEGAEFEALKGAENTLKNKPRIIAELHTAPIRQQVLDFLKKHGYRVSYEEMITPGITWQTYFEA